MMAHTPWFKPDSNADRIAGIICDGEIVLLERRAPLVWCSVQKGGEWRYIGSLIHCVNGRWIAMRGGREMRNTYETAEDAIAYLQEIA